MKYIDIKDKSIEELTKLVHEKQFLIFNLKQKLKTMQLTNPQEIVEVKKDIARIKTAITAQAKGL